MKDRVKIVIDLLTAIKCKIVGHEIEYGSTCPVTGITKMTCKACGADNMPKHESASFK